MENKHFPSTRHSKHKGPGMERRLFSSKNSKTSTAVTEEESAGTKDKNLTALFHGACCTHRESGRRYTEGFR